MKEQIYILIHGKKVLFEGTKDKCFFKLLDIQPMSCYWAIKYEGYKIILK
jgi:calcineurin-like phosphoesterase family protein